MIKAFLSVYFSVRSAISLIYAVTATCLYLFGILESDAIAQKGRMEII